MFGMEPSAARRSTARERYRQAQERRRRFLYRRLAVVALVIAIGIGMYVAGRLVRARLDLPAATPAGAAMPPGPASALPFTPVDHLPAPDLDGDGIPEQIALGPAEQAMRKVALTAGGSGKAERVIGGPITVPDFPLAIVDLPRGGRVLVLMGALPSLGQTTTEQVRGQPAKIAAGGEPDYKAWQLDATRGLVPVDYYALAAPVKPATDEYILVDKYLNVLWQYSGGQLIATYRVSTGRHLEGPQPSADNQSVNYITPVGRFPIANKSRGLYYGPARLSAGDPKNPLGTRWLGFKVYPGDSGTVWGIHGTIEPEKIGQWASDGGIRLAKADLEALYEKVIVDTTILAVIDSSKPGRSS